MRERRTQTKHQSVYVGSRLKLVVRGKVLPYMPAFQRIGENPPYGMIGRVEETSASFEARTAPRLYPTERLGVKFPGPTRPQSCPTRQGEGHCGCTQRPAFGRIE